VWLTLCSKYLFIRINMAQPVLLVPSLPKYHFYQARRLPPDTKVVAPKPQRVPSPRALVRKSQPTPKTKSKNPDLHVCSQEIQTIMCSRLPTVHKKTPVVRPRIPVAQHVLSTYPVLCLTPPTRSHNPVVLDARFRTQFSQAKQHGADLGIFKFSPPLPEHGPPPTSTWPRLHMSL